MVKTLTTQTMWSWSTPDGVPANKVKGRIAASQGIFQPGAPFYRDASGTWTRQTTTNATGDRIHGFCVGAVNAATTWPLTAATA